MDASKYLNTGTSWQVAAGRALLTAILLGAAAALTTWSQTDEAKQIVLAGMTPFVGALLMRLGVEGYADRPR